MVKEAHLVLREEGHSVVKKWDIIDRVKEELRADYLKKKKARHLSHQDCFAYAAMQFFVYRESLPAKFFKTARRQRRQEDGDG
jgi:hypothetical protein